MTLTPDNAAALLRTAFQEGPIEMKDGMRIRILKDTICGGRKVRAGWVVDAARSDGRLLCGLKKAEEVDPAAVELAEPVTKPDKDPASKPDKDPGKSKKDEDK